MFLAAYMMLGMSFFTSAQIPVFSRPMAVVVIPTSPDDCSEPAELPGISIATSDTLSLDAFWRSVSTAVAEGDFEAYASTFHPDAVLVNGIKGTSYPIADALMGWKQGFDDTRAGNMVASVHFRFSKRLVSDLTAHETGLFRYAYSETGASEAPVSPDDSADSPSVTGNSTGATNATHASRAANSTRVAYIHFEALSIRVDGYWRTLMEYQIREATEQEWNALHQSPE